MVTNPSTPYFKKEIEEFPLCAYALFDDVDDVVFIISLFLGANFALLGVEIRPVAAQRFVFHFLFLPLEKDQLLRYNI
jgi:hypothetical protein